MKVKSIIISVSEYNEVNPAELKKLFAFGARIKKSEYPNGVPLGKYLQRIGNKYEYIHAYSDDNIIINNIELPLSCGADYNNIITINI